MHVEQKEAGQQVESFRIPITVRIGVTGHRDLTSEKINTLRQSVREVLGELDRVLTHTPHTYIVVSPLAEGADRLVAVEVLGWHSANCEPPCLEVPLPMPADEYAKDFATIESKTEFRELLARAGWCKELDSCIVNFEQSTNDTEEVRSLKKENRRKAYRKVGHWVADNCDVLVAIWNGDKAKGIGGTGEIVEYSDTIGRAVSWIHSETREVNHDKYLNRLLDSLEHHDVFNAEDLSISQLMAETDRRFKRLTRQAEEVKVDLNILAPIRHSLLSQFVRATTLAARYQARYLIAGTWVYILAATSVATVTVVTLFFEGRSLFGIPGERLIWLEVAQIVVIVMLLAVSALRGWHRKWIDYRFLAERLRAAMFLFVAGIPCDPPALAGQRRASDEWTIRAFGWIASMCPVPSSVEAIDPVKNFVLDAWIEDQRKFYEGKCHLHEFRHKWLEIAGYAVFGLTAVAAILHANVRSNFLASFAIILPAVGASLAGIRTFREHLRNSKRYESMAEYLKRVVAEIKKESDAKHLQSILLEANEMMMREHTEWRVVMLPDLGARM
jgi:hypothetical protein